MAKPGSKAGSGPAGPRASPSDDPEAEELRELEQRAQELQQQVDRALKEFDGVHRANVQLRERVRAREADQREVLKNLERKVQRNQQYIAALEAQRKALEEERERIESSIREELDVHLERVQRAQGRVKELEEDWTHKAELLERAGQVLAHNQKLQQEVADLEAQVKHIEELIDLRQRQENVLATVMRPAEEGVEGTAGGETAAAAPKYDLGVLPLLVEAPRQFPSVAGVHHECCVTLYHLLLDAPDRAYDAMALGGLDVAVNALTAFGTELPTRHVACRLAAQLAEFGATALPATESLTQLAVLAELMPAFVADALASRLLCRAIELLAARVRPERAEAAQHGSAGAGAGAWRTAPRSVLAGGAAAAVEGGAAAVEEAAPPPSVRSPDGGDEDSMPRFVARRPTATLDSGALPLTCVHRSDWVPVLLGVATSLQDHLAIAIPVFRCTWALLDCAATRTSAADGALRNASLRAAAASLLSAGTSDDAGLQSTAALLGRALSVANAVKWRGCIHTAASAQAKVRFYFAPAATPTDALRQLRHWLWQGPAAAMVRGVILSILREDGGSAAQAGGGDCPWAGLGTRSKWPRYAKALLRALEEDAAAEDGIAADGAVVGGALAGEGAASAPAREAGDVADEAVAEGGSASDMVAADIALEEARAQAAEGAEEAKVR